MRKLWFFFSCRASFDGKYRNFIRYLNDIGAIDLSGSGEEKRETFFVTNKEIAKAWVFEKSRSIFEKQLEISQEVIALAQAKNINEKEIWSLPLMEYYGQLKAFIKYSEEREKKMKEN